jgi:hypothetical protein
LIKLEIREKEMYGELPQKAREGVKLFGLINWLLLQEK